MSRPDSPSALFSLANSSSIFSTVSSPLQTSADDDGECRLLGPFAIIVQAALGALALLSLVFKRWRERPQRPLKIWGFDVSKQVVGSVLLHVANLLMSEISSGQGPRVGGPHNSNGTLVALGSIDNINGTGMEMEGASDSGGNVARLVVRGLGIAIRGAMAGQEGGGPPDEPPEGRNPCSFYLLNLAIDTTIGIPILITLLKLFTHAFKLTALAQPPESIKSGNYGRPPQTAWWLKQCLIYFCGLLGMKLCVFFIFAICPWLGKVGDWALKWTEGNETLQIAFVMLIFPVIMNALQYYIIDSFIKEQNTEGYDAIEEEEGDGDDDRETAVAHERDVDGEDSGKISGVDEENPAKKERRTRQGSNKALGGDEEETAGSSESSRTAEESALLSTDTTKGH